MLDPNPPPRVRGQTSGGGRQTFKLKIEDADVDMAAKRASLDRIVKRAEAEECGWGTTDEESQAIYAFYNLTIEKFRAISCFLCCRVSDGLDVLAQYGVATQLLLRIELGAAWMFLALGLLSIAAIVENLDANEGDVQSNNTDALATFFGNVRDAGDNMARIGLVSDAYRNATTSAVDKASDFVKMGLTNSTTLYLATTLGYSLASVEVNEIRLQNWLSIANVLVMVLFLIWVRRKMRDKSWKADAACTTASDYTVMLQHLRTDESPEFFERQIAAYFDGQSAGAAVDNFGGKPPWMFGMYGEAKTVLEDDSNAKEAELLLKLPSDGKRTTGLRAHLKNFGRKGDDFGVDWDGRPLSLGEYQWNNLEKSLKTELRKILTEKLGVTQSVASFNIEPVGYDAKTGDFTAIVAKAVLLDDGAKAAAAPVKKASVAAAPAPSGGFFGLFGGGGALFGRQPSCKNVAASDGVELLSGANADDGRPRTLTTGSVKVSEQSNKVWYDLEKHFPLTLCGMSCEKYSKPVGSFDLYTNKVRVEMGIACSDYMELLMTRKAKVIGYAEARARERAHKISKKEVEKAEAELKKVDNDLRRAAAKKRDPSGVAFVTFQTIKERDQCLHAFLQSDREIVSHILSGRRTLRGAMKNETPLLTAKFGQNKHVAGVSYADVDVICSAAPEPEDIYWENLGTPRAQQLRAFWFTMLVLTILLGASAGIMVYIKHIVNDAKARTACCVGIIYETELARLQGVYDIWNASGPTFNETVWGPDAASDFAAVMADTGNASDYGSGIYDELQTVASWETATCEYERRDDYLLKDIVNQKSCVFVGIDFGGIDYSGITDKDSYTASDFVLFVLLKSAAPLLLGGIASLVLVVLNGVIKQVVYAMVSREKKPTRSFREKSVFYKLSFAYIINSVLLLMFVYADDYKRWYQDGNVVQQALFYMVADLIFNSGLRLVPYFSWIFRFIGRKTSYSACKLQEWYKAPLMFTAEMYASIVRTYALTIFYGPMAPLVYFVGVISMVVNYTTSKYAMFHYYKVPVRMNDELCEGLREILAILMIGHIVVAGFSYSQACEEPGLCRAWLPVLGCVGVYVFYLVVPCKYMKCLTRYRMDATDMADCCGLGSLLTSRMDDEGIWEGNLRYDQRVAKMDAEAVKGHGTISKQHHLWSYKCPVGSANQSIEDQEFFHRLVARSDFTPEFHRIPHCLPARTGGSVKNVNPLSKRADGTEAV